MTKELKIECFVSKIWEGKFFFCYFAFVFEIRFHCIDLAGPNKTKRSTFFDPELLVCASIPGLAVVYNLYNGTKHIKISI